MPINVAWRPMPPTHAAAAAHPPYVSIIFQGTTKRGLSGSPPPTSREACVQDRHPRDGSRDTPTELPVKDPRGSINPQEVSTPIDVGRLAHSDKNRASRHLSSTSESFVIFLALEGGPMSQERPTSNPNAEHPGGTINLTVGRSSPPRAGKRSKPRHQPTNICTSLDRRCGRKHPNRGRPKGNTPEEHPAHRPRPRSRTRTSR
ncbi:hypothetical protein BHE74_00053371 [Ensete ventricosum]|nr:hypothetical protein BHE74_00053371 [Ensete ventricosum]